MATITDYPKTVKTWATGYRTIIEDVYNQLSTKEYREGVFNISDTEMMEERDVELNGIGDFEVWSEDQAAAMDDLREGYASTYRQVSYARRIKFGRLARSFVSWKPELVKKASQRLGRKAYKIQQTEPFSLFTNGFATTVSNGYGDGKPTFSTLHPRSPQDSTTWSNALSASNVVGETALFLMIDKLDETPDDQGDRLHLGENGYVWLVTNMSDFKTAQRIASPDADERPGTANREINVVAGEVKGLGRPIEVRYVPWLYSSTNPNAHYLVARGETQLNILYSERFYTDEYMDPDTDTMFIRGRVMFAYGVGSPRGIVGSKGDGTTYSS